MQSAKCKKAKRQKGKNAKCKMQNTQCKNAKMEKNQNAQMQNVKCVESVSLSLGGPFNAAGSPLGWQGDGRS